MTPRVYISPDCCTGDCYSSSSAKDGELTDSVADHSFNARIICQGLEGVLDEIDVCHSSSDGIDP